MITFFQKTNGIWKKVFTFVGRKIWQVVPTEFKSLNYANFKKKTEIPLT